MAGCPDPRSQRSVRSSTVLTRKRHARTPSLFQPLPGPELCPGAGIGGDAFAGRALCRARRRQRGCGGRACAGRNAGRISADMHGRGYHPDAGGWRRACVTDRCPFQLSDLHQPGRLRFRHAAGQCCGGVPACRLCAGCAARRGARTRQSASGRTGPDPRAPASAFLNDRAARAVRPGLNLPHRRPRPRALLRARLR